VKGQAFETDKQKQKRPFRFKHTLLPLALLKMFGFTLQIHPFLNILHISEGGGQNFIFESVGAYSPLAYVDQQMHFCLQSI